MRGRDREAAPDARALPRREHADTLPEGRARDAAHPRVPARAPARGVPRTVLGQEGSHRRQRARRHLRRAGIPGGVLSQSPGRHPARRRQLHLARDLQGPRQRRDRRLHLSRRGRETGRVEGQEPIGGICHQPQPAGPARQDRPPHRTPRRDRAHHPDTLPAAQEQPALRRRGGGRQDRDRGRAGEDDRGRRSARGAGTIRHLRARPRRPARRHQVPGGLREAAEGGAGPVGQGRRRDPLHRRDPHHHRRGGGLRRSHGRLQPHQADARIRRPALHRLDDLP